MEEYFASIPLSNSSVLCVGGITRSEAEKAKEEGLPIDGVGYYLFVASQDDPRKPIEILAKLVSEMSADKLRRLFNREPATV